MKTVAWRTLLSAHKIAYHTHKEACMEVVRLCSFYKQSIPTTAVLSDKQRTLKSMQRFDVLSCYVSNFC